METDLDLYCPSCGHHGMTVSIEEAINDTKLDIICTCKGCNRVFNEFVALDEMSQIGEGE